MSILRRGRPPGDGLAYQVPLARFLRVYAELVEEHRRKGWKAPRQVDVMAALDWPNERAVRRYLEDHRARWPSVRGGPIELLTPVSADSRPASRLAG